MGWEREAEFKQLLAKCCSKASRAHIDKLVQIAVEDHNQVSSGSYIFKQCTSASNSSLGAFPYDLSGVWAQQSPLKHERLISVAVRGPT